MSVPGLRAPAGRAGAVWTLPSFRISLATLVTRTSALSSVVPRGQSVSVHISVGSVSLMAVSIRFAD